MKALAYLGFRQLINSIKNLLRSPKRLIIGFILTLWFLIFVFRNLIYRGRFPNAVEPMIGQVTGPDVQAIWTFMFVLLSFGVLAVIYSAFSDGLLIFPLSEVDFLFPTPISRRAVLAVKVFRDHLKAVLWITFFLLIAAPGVERLNGQPAFPGIVYVWLALFLLWTSTAHTAHIVNVLATFQIAKLKFMHTAFKIALVGIVLLLFMAIVLLPRPSESVSLLKISPLSKVLFPISWATNLVLTPIWGMTNESAPQVLGLLALSAVTFGTLLSLRHNIYEPTLGVSVRAAGIRAAYRMGGVAALRTEALRGRAASAGGRSLIPMFGRGASALLWKNLVTRLRAAPLATAAVVVLPPLIVWIAARFLNRIPGDFHPGILLGGVAYFAWILTWSAVHEIKYQLRQADMLKPMPFHPIGAMLYIGLGAAVPAVLFSISSVLSLWGFFPTIGSYLAISALVGLPAVIIALVSSHEIVALMYPNLRDLVQGFFGSWLSIMLSSVAAVPSAIAVGAGFAFRLHPFFVAAALALINGCAMVLFCGVAGLMFQKFDPTAD